MASQFANSIPFRLLLGVSLAIVGVVSARADDDPVARGRYLVTIMDCGGCHTGGALVGQPDARRYLAGSDIGFGGPDGVVYPPNLTPDADTGLGKWSAEDIVQAVRTGRRPDGRILAPVMPWPNYASLEDRDARAIAAYLRSLPAITFRAPAPVAAGAKPTSPYLMLHKPT